MWHHERRAVSLSARLRRPISDQWIPTRAAAERHCLDRRVRHSALPPDCSHHRSAAGSETASAIVITDVLDSNLSTPTDPARQYATGRSIQLTAPNLYAGAPTALTDASGDDEATISAQTATVTGIVLLGGESATVKILAEIQ